MPASTGRQYMTERVEGGEEAQDDGAWAVPTSCRQQSRGHEDHLPRTNTTDSHEKIPPTPPHSKALHHSVELTHRPQPPQPDAYKHLPPPWFNQSAFLFSTIS
ncbi:unnamed protein product, partial [Ectocarpus sp. 13 AM-2016]